MSHYDTTLDKVVSLTPQQNAVVVVVIIRSNLTLSASDISSSTGL